MVLFVQIFNPEITKHILIFIYMIPFFLGASLFTLMAVFASKGKEYFSSLYTGMRNFYVCFFVFFFVNYIMSYIDYLNTDFTPNIPLFVMHDISFVLFVCFWIKSNDISRSICFKYIICPASFVYVTLWFIYYLNRDLAFISMPAFRLVILIYDTVFFSLSIFCLVYCLIVYIRHRRTHENRMYFIITNLILIIYLLYMYLTDLYINIRNILDIYVSVYNVYFFDLILPVSIAVSLTALVTFFRTLCNANIVEHEKYLAQIESSRKVSPQEFMEKNNLSAREKEVLEAVLLGKNNKEIADELYISIYTVKRHMSHIFQKTDTKSRYELMSKFNSFKE